MGNSPANYTDPSGNLRFQGNPFLDAANTVDSIVGLTGYRGPTIRGTLRDNVPGLSTFDYDISINAGEGFAEDAQEWYADRFVDPNTPVWQKPLLFAGGSLASLWTCENSDATLTTLGAAWSVSKFAANTKVSDVQQGLKGFKDKADNFFGSGKNSLRISGNFPVAGPADFMNNLDGFSINASKRSDIDPNGFFDVVAHGTPNKIQIQTPNGPKLVDHRTAARLIQQQPGYNGQHIRLLSCNTGACDTGFAQNLSNQLNVTVQAPTDILWAYPDETLVVAPKGKDGFPILSKPGSMKTFTPRSSQ